MDTLTDPLLRAHAIVLEAYDEIAKAEERRRTFRATATPVELDLLHARLDALDD